MPNALNSNILSIHTYLYIYIFPCRAFVDYKKEFVKGDDKTKPDWNARKSCNYMTATVEVNIFKYLEIKNHLVKLN